MVTTNDNNKQENMVNNEHENHTEEYQEEGFFAKNKNMVLGFGALAVIALFVWGMYGTKAPDADANAAKNQGNYTERIKAWWNGSFMNGPLTRKEAGITAVGLAATALVLRRTKWHHKLYNKYIDARISRLNKRPDAETAGSVTKKEIDRLAALQYKI